jgi:hypothetical protein
MKDKPNPPADILADILNDQHTGAIRGLDELNKLIHVKPGDPPVARAAATPRKTKVPDHKKQRTTHYLTRKVFDHLGEARDGLRDLLPQDAKSKASKSRIVESAITMVLQEFGEKGMDSALVRELLKKLEDE